MDEIYDTVKKLEKEWQITVADDGLEALYILFGNEKDLDQLLDHVCDDVTANSEDEGEFIVDSYDIIGRIVQNFNDPENRYLPKFFVPRSEFLGLKYPSYRIDPHIPVTSRIKGYDDGVLRALIKNPSLKKMPFLVVRTCRFST